MTSEPSQLEFIEVETTDSSEGDPHRTVELAKWDNVVKLTLTGSFTREQVTDILKTIYA